MWKGLARSDSAVAPGHINSCIWLDDTKCRCFFFKKKAYVGCIEFDGRWDDRQNIEAFLVNNLGIFGHGICQSLSNCRADSDE